MPTRYCRRVSPLPFEVFSFRSVGDAIARALQIDHSPDCRIVNGRTVLTFRRLGAARWPEAQQVEFALRAAAVARAVLADDRSRQLAGLVWLISASWSDDNVSRYDQATE